ncbi:MAG: hypothetical protein KBT36_01505 [Kurthia sp.]|nr:hypothetical protein [Candidatus Kurthia equi]
MFKQIFMILAVLPVCFLIDLFNGSNWYDAYKQFILTYWDILLVAIISISVFIKNQKYQFQVFDDLRRDQFFAEMSRYLDTPYLAPIMAMYLKNPPGSVYPTDYEYVNDTFYRTVVNAFRDRVYIFQDVHSFDPYARTPYLEVYGTSRFFKCLFYFLAPFTWYAFVTYGLNLSMLQDWPLLTLPFALVSFQRCSYLIHGFVKYLPSNLDRALADNDCDKPITWRDAFPDREIGTTFVRAYYFELERRQRYEMTIQGKTVPHVYPKWNNGNFAPFPYPSDNLPTWQDAYDSYYEDKKMELHHSKMAIQYNDKSNKGNVVSFPKSKTN